MKISLTFILNLLIQDLIDAGRNKEDIFNFLVLKLDLHLPLKEDFKFSYNRGQEIERIFNSVFSNIDSRKFNELNEFLKQIKGSDYLEKTVLQLKNISDMKLIAEKLLKDFSREFDNQDLNPELKLAYGILSAQFFLYYLENQNEILIKTLEDLPNSEVKSFWLSLLYELRNSINKRKIIYGFVNLLEKFGAEVEEIIDPMIKIFQLFQLKVVEINKVEKHTNSDRLNICTIFDGVGTREVVCGGKNVKNIYDNRLKTVYAEVGQIIPCNMVLEPREIRGVISNGMLCSTEELCIDFPNNEVDGIAELSENAEVGKSSLLYLLDKFNFSIIFDLSITPNLDKAISLLGLYEVIRSYIFRDELIKKIVSEKYFEINSSIIVNTEENVVDNVFFHVFEDIAKYNNCSQKMKSLLASHEFEIHNNIIDIINFISINIGAVPHIIDLDKINGKLQIVKSDKEREGVNKGDIIVTDESNNLIAIPGLYDNPEYSFKEGKTKSLLIFFIVFAENLNNDLNIGFNKMLQVARRNKISNKMLYFYERGRIDESKLRGGFDIPLKERIAKIEFNAINERINSSDYQFKSIKLFLRDVLILFKIPAVLYEAEEACTIIMHETDAYGVYGIEFDTLSSLVEGKSLLKYFLNILANLGIASNDQEEVTEDWVVSVKVFKHWKNLNSSKELAFELSKFFDVVHDKYILKNGLLEKFERDEKIEILSCEQRMRYEEFNKLYNEKIDSTNYSQYDNIKLNEKLKQALTNRGFSEVYNFSFIDKKRANLNEEYLVHLSSPVNKSLTVLRSSIFSSLLENLVEILKDRKENIAIFECAEVYTKYNISQRNITGIRAGKKFLRSTHISDKKDFNFYDIKADFLEALKIYNIDEDDLKFIKISDINTNQEVIDSLKKNNLLFNSISQHSQFFHPSKSAFVIFNDVPLGYLGEIHPKIIQEYDITSNICGFTIIIESLELIGIQSKKCFFESIYQSVYKDLAFVFDYKITINQIKSCIKKASENEDILREIVIFDIYQDEKLKSENKQSVAFSLKLQSQKYTLSDKQVLDFMTKIIYSLKNEFNCYMTFDEIKN